MRIAIVTLTLLLGSAGLAWACTTNTIYGPNGRITMCTTCCFGTSCTTTCF